LSFVLAILGLALLVLIHEAGHFFAARAVGMKPRKFYVGFPPPLVKRVHNGIEYGIGAIPLGGYVKIPGMNRPSPGDLSAALKPELRDEHVAELARLDNALARENDTDARAALEELQPALGKTRAWQELDMALAPDAYWRQATWRRLVAIGAGPAVNLVFAVILFTAVFMVATDTNRSTNIVAAVQSGSPAQHVGLQSNDKIVRIAGKPVNPETMAQQIRATHGRAFALAVRRDGKLVALGPVHARLDHGAYRIGIAIQGKLGPGASLPHATVMAFKETWYDVRGTVVGMTHLFGGQDTQNVQSSVGIVRTSAAAARDGVRTFLYILGAISLALGIFNLIPVLPLDGGHIAIALVEKLRGRTFAQSVYVKYSLIGFSLFAILMYIGLRNDLFGGGG
jgi:regulator of sigma E protease